MGRAQPDHNVEGNIYLFIAWLPSLVTSFFIAFAVKITDIIVAVEGSMYSYNDLLTV